MHFSIKPTYNGMCGNISFYMSDYSLLCNWWLNDITYIKKITFSSLAQIWSMIRKQLHFSIKTTYTRKCGNISFYLSDYSLLWNRQLNDITDIEKITFSSIAQIWRMIRKQLHFSIKPTYTGMCGNISFYQ